MDVTRQAKLGKKEAQPGVEGIRAVPEARPREGISGAAMEQSGTQHQEASPRH